MSRATGRGQMASLLLILNRCPLPASLRQLLRLIRPKFDRLTWSIRSEPIDVGSGNRQETHGALSGRPLDARNVKFRKQVSGKFRPPDVRAVFVFSAS